METVYKELEEIFKNNINSGEYEKYSDKTIEKAGHFLNGDIAFIDSETKRVVGSVVRAFKETSKGKLPNHLSGFAAVVRR